MIKIDQARCTGCGACVEICPHGALYLVEGVATLDPALCRACEACVAACPVEAITLLTTAPKPATRAVAVQARRKEPEVIHVDTSHAPVLWRDTLAPALGAALAWAGREIVPRLADYLLDGLDRRSARQQRADLTQRAASDERGVQRGGGGGGGGGRRRRRRRRGGGGG
jgi:NAD-dependent dihydropyrimidine dehydrogenase PreA subunit